MVHTNPSIPKAEIKRPIMNQVTNNIDNENQNDIQGDNYYIDNLEKQTETPYINRVEYDVNSNLYYFIDNNENVIGTRHKDILILFVP